MQVSLFALKPEGLLTPHSAGVEFQTDFLKAGKAPEVQRSIAAPSCSQRAAVL